MDLMEQLLCPQVCMDVEDTPLEIEAPPNEPGENPEANLGSLPIELRARLILDNDFAFAPEQVPMKLTPEEQKEIKGADFSQVEYLKHAKLHCTVCNKHIGTSLVEQMDRYIHPELNTLMCHNCYKFYGTGEFEKDEDGSEIFCKWCGQGGNVMCCEACPLVFCQLCVRRNLGFGKLTQIKKLDNWRCFKCDGRQISKFHITCHVLHEYTNKQLRAAVATRNMFLVKDDFSTCCTKKKRRIGSDSDDENDDYLPHQKVPKMKPKSAKSDIIKAPASGIVKRALNTINSAQPFAPQTNLFQSLQFQTLPATNSQPVVKFQVGRANAAPTANLPTLADLMPNLFGSMLPNAGAGAAATQPIRVQYQPVKQPNQQIHFVNPKPNMNTTWLNDACAMAKLQGAALVRETDGVVKSSKTSKSYADLANLHNRLQRAMANCTNKLIVARKQMHKDFLKYLKTNHVSHSSVVTNDLSKPLATSRTGLAAGSKAGPASKRLKGIDRRGTSAEKAGATPGVVTDPIDLCDDDDDEGVEAQILNDDPLAISDDEEDSMVSNNVFNMQPEILTCDDSVDLTDDIPVPPAVPIQKNSVQAQNGGIAAEETNVRDSIVTKTSDASRLTPKEYKRAISVRVMLSNEPLLDLQKSFMKKKGARRENALPDVGAVHSSTGFDFVREMQNVIESASVRSIDGSPPLIPESDANASTPCATSPSATPNPASDAEMGNGLPGIDKALEAIKQLTESITETQTMDINSNDNAKNVESVPTVPSAVRPLDLNQRSGTNGDGGGASNMKGDILNDTPPAICLEDMVKIYDACETTIDGDMVPAD